MTYIETERLRLRQWERERSSCFYRHEPRSTGHGIFSENINIRGKRNT